jgi:hypothetical protein
MTALLDTKLGDVLLAAISKDPPDAGRLIAQAITGVESPETVAPAAADKTTLPAVPTPKAAA